MKESNQNKDVLWDYSRRVMWFATDSENPINTELNITPSNVEVELNIVCGSSKLSFYNYFRKLTYFITYNEK